MWDLLPERRERSEEERGERRAKMRGGRTRTKPRCAFDSLCSGFIFTAQWTPTAHPNHRDTHHHRTAHSPVYTLPRLFTGIYIITAIHRYTHYHSYSPWFTLSWLFTGIHIIPAIYLDLNYNGYSLVYTLSWLFTGIKTITAIFQDTHFNGYSPIYTIAAIHRYTL